MAWATPQFSRNQVDKAGFIVADEDSNFDDWIWSLNVINNWRASHAYPLNNFQTNLRNKVKKVQNDILVVQRLKRLDSIKSKLVRGQTSTLQLSQMQDIGGCRAVLKNQAGLNKIVTSYKRSRFKHVLKSEKNYIENPKSDGYRGYHLVYQCHSDSAPGSDYNKLRVEVQLRTSLQHAWATAVEAVGTFTQQALKSAQGSEEWRRLFALMGSVIATKEGGPIVPGTPEDIEILKEELSHLSNQLNAVQTLGAYRAALDYIGTLNQRASRYFLVKYDAASNRVLVTGFAGDQSQQASAAYTDAEKNKKIGDNIVLVAADSIAKLQRAYPNYFLDTQQFTELLWDALPPRTI